MSFKEKLLAVLFTIFLSSFCLMPVFETKIEAKEIPSKLYQVYLDGEVIGVIKSKKALEAYINKEQTDLKDKYGVSTVYLPEGLNIEEYIGFSNNIVSERDIYKTIKDLKSFTIKGYVVTIESEKPVSINVLNKEDFTNAVNNTVKAFVSEDEFNAFVNNTVDEIKTTGRKIENLYVEENITIKGSLIPSDQKIFTDEKELTKYLLFGNLDEQKEYTIKVGDTIETVAFNNSLGVNEFLVVNPELNNSSNLIYVGQRVKIGLISPIVSIIKEEEVIEDKEMKYKTEIKYDKTKPYGYISVTEPGSNGSQRITQKLKSKNGEILTAVITNSEVLIPTINRVEARGTRSFNDPIIIGDGGDWFWPTNYPYIITSSYGYRWGVLHQGMDISGCGSGSPIYAADAGNVYSSSYESLGGNQVVINHNNGYYTMYAHLLKSYVVKGQAVKRGQIIGLMGSTGYSTGTHLHFGVYAGIPYGGGRSFNPITLFR